MRGRGTPRCFAEVSESRHSPLVLVGAPAQGPCSPLVRVRTKCSLWADSLTLRHGESSTTTHKLDTSHPQEHRVIFVPLITTELSRWQRSPRVTSNGLSLDPHKAKESGGFTLKLLILTREGSLKKSLKSQSSLGSCFSLAPQGVSQLNKWARWISINTPHQVQEPTTQNQQISYAPNTIYVASDALRRESSASPTASCTLKTYSHRTHRSVRCPPPKRVRWENFFDKLPR